MTVFDDNVDVLGIVEDHAREVLELEESQGAKLIKVYAKAAAQMRQRLSKYPRDTFTAQHIRVTLVQLEGAIAAMESDLTNAIDASAEAVATKGVSDLAAEVEEFNGEFRGSVQAVNLDLVQTAVDTKARLLNNYESSIETYSRSLRTAISDGLAQMVVEHTTPEEMYRRMIDDDAIGKFFEGEAWRLRRIVRTELHGMYGSSKLAALGRIADDNPSMRKALFHPSDSRTGPDSLWLIQKQTSGARLNTPTLSLRPKIEDPFFYTWKSPSGKTYRRIYMAPPDRPNDRSILIPYHPSWD